MNFFHHSLMEKYGRVRAKLIGVRAEIDKID
jgi:hypothetical protein